MELGVLPITQLILFVNFKELRYSWQYMYYLGGKKEVLGIQMETSLRNKK